MLSNGLVAVELYLTKDFEIASLLYACGRKLDNQEWINGVCYFHFQDKYACEKVVADYFNNKIVISARDIFNSLHTIKGILKMG